MPLSRNPKLDELAAPTDVTTLNVSTSAHGLTPKLSNVSTEYLSGTGAFSTPASGGVTDRGFDPGIKYVLPGVRPTGQSTGAVGGANRAQFGFLAVDTAITIDALMCNVVTLGAGTTARLGLYVMTSSFALGALVVDAGTVDTSTTGDKVASFTAVQLAAGLYATCIVCDSNTPVFRSVMGGAFDSVRLVDNNTTLVSAVVNTLATGVGAMADPGPVLGLTYGSGGSNGFHRVLLRRSA